MNDSAPAPNLTTLSFQTMEHVKRTGELVAGGIIIERWVGIWTMKA